MRQISKLALSPQARLQRLSYLAIALLPLAGSHFFNWGLSLPFLRCPLLRLTGVPCPAWGMTRSFMAIARGDWQQAIAYHLFGPLLFFGFAIAGGHLLLEFFWGRRIRSFYVDLVCRPTFQISAFLVLLIYHGFRLHLLAESGELYTNFLQSPLAKVLLITTIVNHSG